ncbi:hypothetical protein LguiA_004703 [Lonicera macranthoides]
MLLFGASMATALSLYTKNYNTSSNIIIVKSMATNGTSVEAAPHRRRIIKNNEMMSPLENRVYLVLTLASQTSPGTNTIVNRIYKEAHYGP